MISQLTDICFPLEHQQVLVDIFERHHDQIQKMAETCFDLQPSKIHVDRIAQFLLMSVFQCMCDFVRAKTYRILTHPQASELRQYISKWAGSFPSISVANDRLEQFQQLCMPELLALTGEVLDEFYTRLGEIYRNRYQVLYLTEKKHFVPSIELFFGIYPPSQLWPEEDVRVRGRMMPFLHLYLYQQALHETNLNAIIGKCKEITVQDGRCSYAFASQAGLIGGPPERTKFYHAFHWIEAHLSRLDHDVTEALARNEIMNLIVSSVDCTNVPVDQRDKTGSIGTGSRGSFYGHKHVVSVAGNCLPIASNLDNGRAYDSTLFDDVFWETMNLTTTSMIDLWVWTLDAAFNLPAIVDTIEGEQKIPLIDLNPKNSKLLKSYKQAVNDLVPYSKKAIESLTDEEKKRWEETLRNNSLQHGGQVPFNDKKRYLRTTMENLANIARKKGLTWREKRQEQKLRRKVRLIRQEIEKKGTIAEKKTALQCLIHGTIEWFLAYDIRGQNEGYNGILKKRNDLIGDGQHTTWIITHSKIAGRTEGIVTAIKCIAWVRFVVTGDRRELLCILVNWRHEHDFFLAIIVVIFCRKNPIKI